MKSHILASIVALTMLSGSALAELATVKLSVTAKMQSLRDQEQLDAFTVDIADAQINTKIALNCQAGISKWWGGRRDEACAAAGNGYVVNPKDGKLLPRTQYSGGFTITKTGFTDGTTLKVTYLPLGKVLGSEAQFGGNLVMKPENPSQTALDIGKMLVDKISGEEGVGALIDKRIDTVGLERFFTPSAGLPADKGCTWSGDMVYAYQTESWLMKLKADCGDGKVYELAGNMPWVDVDDEGNAQYALNLALPSATAATDDALFADATEDDLFATADGISGTLNITQSSFVTVEVDGAPEELASQIEASGTFTGTNVPLTVVRSFAMMMGIMSRTFFGA